VIAKQLTTLTAYFYKHLKSKNMHFLFLKEDLKFLKDTNIDFEIVEKKDNDDNYCIINTNYDPYLLFNAFRSGIICSIDKIKSNDFA
jgi:hypothetical protein